MKRIGLLLAGLGAASLTAGCAPSVVVENNGAFTVRAIIGAGGMSDVVSPSPGESSFVEVREGPYTAIVSGVGGTTGVGLVEVFEVP